jgi:hypothetical protein
MGRKAGGISIKFPPGFHQSIQGIVDVGQDLGWRAAFGDKARHVGTGDRVDAARISLQTETNGGRLHVIVHRGTIVSLPVKGSNMLLWEEIEVCRGKGADNGD